MVYAAAVGVTLANSAILITRPWLLHVLIDDVFGQGDRALLIPTLAGIAGLGLAFGMGAVLGHLLYTRAAQGAVTELRAEVLRHAHRLSLRDLRSRRTGEIVALVTSDAEVASGYYMDSVSLVFAQLFRLLAYLVIPFAIDWRLGLVALASVPLHALLATRLQAPTQAASRRVQEAVGRLTALLTEFIGGARDVKAFNQHAWAGARIDDEATRLWQARVQLVLIKSVRWISQLMYWASYIAIWAVLAGPVVGGELTLGLLVAAGQYFLQLSQPIRDGVRGYVDLGVSGGAARRVFAFLTTGDDLATAPAGRAAAITSGTVAFEDVAFHYDNGQPVLHGVSFRAEGGKTTALVGPSGAGKTTLIHLLLRFYSPTAGHISVDGANLAALDTQAFRAQIGVVFQDAVLFDGSIDDNIRFGRDGIAHEQVVAAAKAANAHDFICATESGYKTHIGERGIRLSGGQAQRLAIARAILCDPEILILDEATAFLDAQSERLAQEALERAASTRTTIVIAHRLATVRRADQIVVLDQGRVLDTGRHEELYTRNERYRRLCDLQFLRPEAAAA